MPRYEIIYAEDVPHYCAVEIEADSPDEAVRIAGEYDYGDAAIDPDWSNPVCQRIVSIHDDTGRAIAEDISLDGCFLRYGGEAEERLCDAASEMLGALRSALDFIESGRIDGESRLAAQVRDDIRTVIAKAEGIDPTLEKMKSNGGKIRRARQHRPAGAAGFYCQCGRVLLFWISYVSCVIIYIWKIK